MKELELALLKKELKNLNDAAKTLSRSHKKCLEIGDKKEYSLEELDHFEGLTSRFARLSDLILQKVLRLIENLDLDPPGTIRDRINRAEKKGLIHSAKVFVGIRDLRNHIAHEYQNTELGQIYKQVIENTPNILETIHLIQEYCKKY